MGTIHRQEAALYQEVWAGLDHYGDLSPGEQWAEAFLVMTHGHVGDTVLDAGCGSGKGAIKLGQRGFVVTLCDLTDEGLVAEARALPFFSACLWDDLRHDRNPYWGVDWVYCCDVLEHIPMEFSMLAIARMLAVAKRGLFLSITFVPDCFGALLGRPLHQTVQPYQWWKERLGELGDVVETRDLLASGLFLVRAR